MFRDTHAEHTTHEEESAVMGVKRKFTKEERQAIYEDHLKKHDGHYDPATFVDEAEDPNHPAHDALEWDDTIAGRAYRIEQARRFVSDLKVKWVDVTVDSRLKTMPTPKYSPMAFSPMTETGARIESYVTLDLNDETRQKQFVFEARKRLNEYLKRYEMALEIVGISETPFRNALNRMDKFTNS
jgi:hypothetical protein